MRSIKFRVWDKSVPTYAEVMEEKEATGQMINWEYAKELSYLVDAINGKYPIMQFTGLLDKNGVEIYEFDVVKNSLNDILEVVWNEDRCCFEMRGRYEKSYLQRQLDCDIVIDISVEVIGNVYEHPHLLEVNNE
jgi:uncharacterized phage protein (TIGR01671 family)